MVTRRWKGFSEFIWWSCFSWYAKGPYHIWELETKAEREAYLKDLAARNAARYELDKMEWELSYSLERIQLRGNRPGPRARFNHAKNGAYILEEGRVVLIGIGIRRRSLNQSF